MIRLPLFVLFALVTLAPRAGAQSLELFNGHDLAGWTFITKNASAKIDDTWTVHDGLLHCSGKPTGYLRTQKAFGPDYELTVEYRYLKPGNSGLLVAVTGPDKIWPHSIEPQIKPGETGDLFGMGGLRLKVDPDRSEIRGGNERTKRAEPKEAEKIDGWNIYTVKLSNGTITLTVNGVVENTATGVPNEPGAIGICSEGAELEVRKVSLHPITSPATQGSK